MKVGFSVPGFRVKLGLYHSHIGERPAIDLELDPLVCRNGMLVGSTWRAAQIDVEVRAKLRGELQQARGDGLRRLGKSRQYCR